MIEDIGHLLYSYRKSKAQIEILELDIQLLSHDYKDIDDVTYKKRENNLKRLKLKRELDIMKVENSLEILTEREQEIINLRYFQGLSFQKIAERLFLGNTTIQKANNKALRRISDVLLVSN